MILCSLAKVAVVRRTFPFAALAQPRCGNALMIAAAMFALGLAAGAALRPSLSARDATPVEAAIAAPNAAEPPFADIPLAHRLDPSIVYPAEVLRVIDGDTFEARVRVWPGL